MYAVVITVSMNPVNGETNRATLHDYVVPRAKQHAGFVKGTWLGDGATGISVVTYDSQETAEKAAAGVAAPADPITIESVQVHEVQAEA